MEPSYSNSLSLEENELNQLEMQSLAEKSNIQACKISLSCTCFHTLVNASLCFIGEEISKEEFSTLIIEILKSFTQAGIAKDEMYQLVNPMGELFTKAYRCLEN
ncbi:MAG: hypothetical protein ACTSYA_08485 [Candidatus Kariarchaeaceae archaeon]